MTVTLSGTTGTQQPATQLAGSSSGAVTLTGAANAGTWTMTLPTSGGTNGYYLQTDGTGVTSWVAVTGGGNVSSSGTPTANQIAIWTNSSTIQGVTNLPVTNLNSGTGASSTTFWRGDGTWATPAGGGSGTVNSGLANQLAYYAANGTAVSGGFAPTTAGNVLFTTDGSTWSSTQKIVRGTSVATTSGTSIDFTSIPSWVKRITLIFQGVSTNGTSIKLVQIGSGSVQNTGYVSSGLYAGNGSSAGATSSTAGFPIYSNSAAEIISGHMIFTPLSGNLWVSSSTFKWSTTFGGFGGGDVTLSGALDRVRLTTVNGTDTFDAGSINILYE